MIKTLSKRKTKLIMAVVSLSLAFSFMAFGIYAAVDRQASITGRLSFTSDSVDATITVSRAVGSAAYTTVDTISFASGGGNQTGEDVELGTMAFSDTVTTIKYKVAVAVATASRAARLVYADSATVPNGVTRVATKKVGTATATTLTTPTADTIASISAGTTVEYEFTYTLNPKTAEAFSATNAIASTFTLNRL